MRGFGISGEHPRAELVYVTIRLARYLVAATDLMWKYGKALRLEALDNDRRVRLHLSREISEQLFVLFCQRGRCRWAS